MRRENTPLFLLQPQALIARNAQPSHSLLLEAQAAAAMLGFILFKILAPMILGLTQVPDIVIHAISELTNLRPGHQIALYVHQEDMQAS